MSRELADAWREIDDNEVRPVAAKWSDSFASRVVAQDFASADAWRSTNHDPRWKQHIQDFIGERAPKIWEGTRIPRANVAVHTILEQVESLLPRILTAIFGDDPWFQTLAMAQTTPEAARVVRDTLLAQLHSPYCNIREVLRRGLKSELLHGNGIYQLEWMHEERERRRFMPEFYPETKKTMDPMTGMETTQPTGRMRRRVKEFTETEKINQPRLVHVSLFDFYVDPNTPGPNPKEARFCIRRCLMPIDELMALAKTDGFNIPDKAFLVEIAQQKSTTQGDDTKRFAEAMRGVNWNPTDETTADPSGHRAEVLQYWTRDRHVWALRTASGVLPIFNKPNPFGFMPFYSSFHTDLLDRFYAIGMSDLLEGEQQLQGDIINARIDELSLSIHPPTVYKLGSPQPLYKLRMRPGGEYGADDPSRDVIRHYPQNVTQNAFAEVEMSNMRAQKKTGVSDMAAMGAPSATNPGARSGTGAMLQGQAFFTRSQYHVENLENLVLEPALIDMHELNERYLDPEQIIDALDGASIDPIHIFGAKVQFRMRAGSRMRSTVTLLQALPMVMNAIMNPALMEQLAMEGKTIDFIALFKMITDATGYKMHAELVRPLTPEEQQARQAAQQQVPPDLMIKERMQDKRMETMREMQTDKFEQDAVQKLLLTLMQKQADGNLNPPGSSGNGLPASPSLARVG